MEHVDVAARMGASEGEILKFDETPAGLVISHADGTTYIDVPEDTPDANGKTGLMFLYAPENYKDVPGAFPVYAQPVEEIEPDAPGPYAELDRDELLAFAEAEGVTIDKRWGDNRIREVLQQHAAELEAAAVKPAPDGSDAA